MAMDQPTISYHKDKKEGSHNKREMDALADSWAKRHKSVAGQRISLKDYLNNNNALKK
jgi:hypothetical protein